MSEYTESELFAAVKAGYHAPDDLPLATRSWLNGYRAGQKTAQAQASKPIAVVTGWYDGRCVIEPLDRALAIPVGMALYSQPQAQAVNQQLLEALKKAERSLLSTMMAVTEPSPRRFKEQGWELVLDIKAAIAAAQEQGND